VLKDAKLKQVCGTAWDDMADTLAICKPIYQNYILLERSNSYSRIGTAFNSTLFDIARTIVRLTDETSKPNAERLREYSESNLESLKQELFSEAPIYDGLETAKLADSLSMFMQTKGVNDELVQKVMAGKSPSERAAELIRGTKLKDVFFPEAIDRWWSCSCGEFA